MLKDNWNAAMILLSQKGCHFPFKHGDPGYPLGANVPFSLTHLIQG